MLHNICKERNFPVPNEEEGNDGEHAEGGNSEPLMPQPPAAGRPREGLLYRDEFVNLHFK